MKKGYLFLALLAVLLASLFSCLYIQVVDLNQTLDAMKRTQLEMNDDWENKTNILGSSWESKMSILGSILESKTNGLEIENTLLKESLNDLKIADKWLNENLTSLNLSLDSLNETQLRTVAFIVYQKEERFYAIDGLTGAMCCNETDAYQVIQSAINQTRENGGGTVFLKEGVYPITATLELVGGVSLCGSGEQSTVLVAMSPATMVRTVRNTYGEIKDIYLDMNYTASVGIVISDTYYNDIHIAITHLKELSTGVQVQVTQDELGCFYNKIWANIEGNQSTWSTGIYLTSSVNVTPNFNYFSGNIRDVDMGMLIARGKEEIVEHMDVEGCKRTGYYIADNRSLFIGCYSENNGEYGYYLCGKAYTTIIGGYDGGNQLGNFGGETGSQYVIVGGNKMEFIVWTESGETKTAVCFENGSMMIYNESTDEPLFEIHPSGDVELCQAGVGIILRSENGTTYRVYVDNDGNLQIKPYP